MENPNSFIIKPNKGMVLFNVYISITDLGGDANANCITNTFYFTSELIKKICIGVKKSSIIDETSSIGWIRFAVLISLFVNFFYNPPSVFFNAVLKGV